MVDAKNPTGSAWQQQLSSLRARWQALQPRERLSLQIAALLLGLLALWSFALQPALRTLSKAPVELAGLETQLQDMRRLASEAAELQHQPGVGVQQAQQALSASSQRLGEAASLTVSGERAVLTLRGVSAEQLQSWLAEVRSGARARPIEASLQRGARGYSGSITLALGVGAP